MNLIAGALLSLGVGIGFAFFVLIPDFIDRSRNRKTGAPLETVRSDTQRFHETLNVADLHSDSLLWRRDLTCDNATGLVDFEKMRKGRVLIQAFSVVTKSPRGINIDRNEDRSDLIQLHAIANLWPTETWTSLKARALFQAQKLEAWAKVTENQFRLIRSQLDLKTLIIDRETNPKLVGGWLTLEGSQALEGDLKNIDILYEVGFRMMAPTHFTDTEISASAHGVSQGGLTPLGREWVKCLEAKKILIDLAHASKQTFQEVLTLATRPVIVSHTGVQGTCPNNRNLSDEQLRQIAKSGGLVGIGFWREASGGEGISEIIKAMQYAASVIGTDHLALGSDWDGSVKTPINASETVVLTQALLDSGFSQDDVRKIMGQNVIHFLEQHLPES